MSKYDNIYEVIRREKQFNWFSEFITPKDAEVHQGDVFICLEICSMYRIWFFYSSVIVNNVVIYSLFIVPAARIYRTLFGVFMNKTPWTDGANSKT